MVRSSDRMCKVDYDSIIEVVLILFSLFNIYLCRFNINKICSWVTSYLSITFKYSLRIHICLIKCRYIRSVSIDPPIEMKQPKSPYFQKICSYLLKYYIEPREVQISI